MLTRLDAHAVYDRLPDEIFEFKLDWDPTLIFFVVILILYTRSLKLFKRQPVETWQKVCFYSGVALLILALLPPIDPLSDQLFWVHMVQHLMITHVGMPLMLFGIPFFVIIRGMPSWFRKRVYVPILKSNVLGFIDKTIGRPLPALIFFEVNYWFWHVPRFYNLALMNDVFHLVEHALFAISSMLLWRNIIDPHPMKAPLPLPARILMLGFIMAVNIILSAILTFADEVLYAYQGIPMPSWFAHWGHLQDQRLGGLIMWVPGGLINLIAMTCVFFVWAKRSGAADLNLDDDSFQKRATSS
jgi:cytochrome c oxidase assembly factor CtaG